MRRYIGKIGTICLVLTLCLAAIGVGYGQWTKTLNIDGAVTTGDFGIEFRNAVPSDNEIPPIADVGVTTATLHDVDGNGDTEVMRINVEDGYLGYVGIVNFEVFNYGSVPAVISEIDITLPVEGDVDVTLAGINVGDIIDPSTALNCVLTAEIINAYTGIEEFTVEIVAVNWNAGP